LGYPERSFLIPAAVILHTGAAQNPLFSLLAADSNGIVAVGDGAPWAGVADLGLPFP
jgi:hypothetical protein